MNRRDLLKSMPALAALPAGASTDKASSKARFRTALCAYSFRDALKEKTLSYADLVRIAVDLNLDGLDLTVYWFPATDDSFLIPLRGLAYRMGVNIYSISIRTDLCRPTAELQEKELAEIRKWVDVAAKLGAGHIRVFGGNVPKESSKEEAAEWVASILRRGAEYSGQKGVILGLENHGGITEQADTILKIVNEVNSIWCGVNLDTGNFRTDVLPQIEKLAPYAVNVQLKSEMREDGVRKPSDWDRIFAILARPGYKGYVALEYEAREDPATEVPKLTRRMQQLARKYNDGASGRSWTDWFRSN